MALCGLGQTFKALGARIAVAGTSELFKENELGDNIAIACRRGIPQVSLFVKSAHDAIESLVGQIVGVIAVPAIEIAHEPPTHFKIAPATGVMSFIEPAQELSEDFGSRRPVSNLLQFRNACCLLGVGRVAIAWAAVGLQDRYPARPPMSQNEQGNPAYCEIREMFLEFRLNPLVDGLPE
jgi:hypothetical protein